MPGGLDSLGFFREVTPDLPGMCAYDAHGQLSAATSGSTPGDGCTDGTGIVNLIYAGDDPVNEVDPSGQSSEVGIGIGVTIAAVGITLFFIGAGPIGILGALAVGGAPDIGLATIGLGTLGAVGGSVVAGLSDIF
jgi:hypothetical protein